MPDRYPEQRRSDNAVVVNGRVVRPGRLQRGTVAMIQADAPGADYLLSFRNDGIAGICRDFPEYADLVGFRPATSPVSASAARGQSDADRALIVRVETCPHRRSDCGCLNKPAACTLGPEPATVTFADCRDRCPLLVSAT